MPCGLVPDRDARPCSLLRTHARMHHAPCGCAGVGILFVEEEDPSGFVRVTVKALIEGGSAERTGMVRAGDMVVRVGNQDVIGKPLSVLRTMIPGPIGSYCRLGFLRGGVALNSNAVQVYAACLLPCSFTAKG